MITAQNSRRKDLFSGVECRRHVIHSHLCLRRGRDENALDADHQQCKGKENEQRIKANQRIKRDHDPFSETLRDRIAISWFNPPVDPVNPIQHVVDSGRNIFLRSICDEITVRESENQRNREKESNLSGERGFGRIKRSSRRSEKAREMRSIKENSTIDATVCIETRHSI